MNLLNSCPTRALCLAFAVGCASQGPSSSPKTAPAQKEGGNASAYFNQAQRLLKIGQLAAAEDRARSATEAPHAKPEMFALLGRILASQQKLPEAIAAYEEAIKRKDRAKSTFAELASVYDVTQKYPEAIATYERYLEIQPNDAEMRQELALTLLLIGEAPKAIEELERVIQDDPENKQAAYDLAYAQLQAGQPEKAKAQLDQLIEGTPKHADLHALLGRVLVSMNEKDDALVAFNKALQLQPEHAAALRGRTRLYVLSRQWTKALADYEATLQKNPKSAAHLVGAATALTELKRYDEARTKLQAAKEVAGEHPEVLLRENILDRRTGSKQASAAIVAFAEENPRHLIAWREVFQSAKAQRNRKLKKKAIARLKALGDSAR